MGKTATDNPYPTRYVMVERSDLESMLRSARRGLETTDTTEKDLHFIRISNTISKELKDQV